MKAYSVDLRERVIKSWENGRAQRWIAREFTIGLSTIKRWIKVYQETGSVEPRHQERMKPLIKESDLVALQTMVDVDPDASLAKDIEQWAQKHSIKVSQATMSRALKRANRPQKKGLLVLKNVMRVSVYSFKIRSTP
jgi:transposase